ncbi:MAG: ribosome silencing factor [Tepidiformaceae bacterium]
MQERGRHGAIHSPGHPDYNPAAAHRPALSFHCGPTYGAHGELLDSESLANRAVDILSDRQAEDIVLVDISRTATFTDYFVIATALSPLQFNALAEHLEKELKPEGHDIRHKEGSPQSGWMLLDFGDIVVHVFSPEQRAFYRLEELWGRTAPVVRFTG